MLTVSSGSQEAAPAGSPDDVPRYRSGAVARMLRMPVATLRVWERRYRVTAPARTVSGQRLYTAADVRRLALLKQLNDLGHAIGSIASLDMVQLQSVASTHASVLAAGPVEAQAPWRVAVVGSELARRLARPALTRRLGRPVQVLGPFESPARALAAARDESADALLLHAPTLHEAWVAEREAAAPLQSGVPTAVLYGFAAEALCDRLAAAGVALLREPQTDAVLGQWLGLLGAGSPAAPAPAAARLAPADEPVPARRWDDAALADFAGLSSTIACECPRHVAELLMQLTRFEAYSAECAHRSPVDAELHAHLRHVAAVSRARFEDALERVASHEGLLGPRGS